MNQIAKMIGGIALGACALGAIGASAMSMKTQAAEIDQQEETVKVEGFYCNIKALTPTERARHRELTEKLLAERAETVESEKGYEFRYRGGKVTLPELAEWAAAESKCCSFLDFHIDLEEAGRLMCLRLTGQEGIKKFIRAEFSLDGKR